MKIIFKLLFLPLLLSALHGLAQQNLDKVWIQGIPISFSTVFTSTGPVNQYWDTTASPFFANGHSNICDGNGNLLIATSGGDIYGSGGNIIDNGDTILPKLTYIDYEGSAPGFQNSIILPLGDSIYYVCTSVMSDSLYTKIFIDGDPSAVVCDDQVLYNVVDMKLNGGAGKVIRKMVPALTGINTSYAGMTACRHGNGKDWWLIKQGNDSNVIYTFLVKKDTVLGPYIQSFSQPAYFSGLNTTQAAMNNAGTKYVFTALNTGKVFMADFDRCSGIFSAPRLYNVPDASKHVPADTTIVDSTTVSLSFSPNDSFLYVGMRYNIQQLELNNPDSATAWVRIAGLDTTYNQFAWYSMLAIGHDNKVYIGNLHGMSTEMSVINKPNLKGLASEFCPKCLRFPKFEFSPTLIGGGVSQPPNMPNYKLGAKNPPCDTIVSVAAVPKQEGLRIYPNPADATLIVEYQNGGRFELTDMLGRVLLQAELVKGQNRLAIKTDHLPAGMYAYRYINAQSGQITGKLVISH